MLVLVLLFMLVLVLVSITFSKLKLKKVLRVKIMCHSVNLYFIDFDNDNMIYDMLYIFAALLLKQTLLIGLNNYSIIDIISVEHD